MFLISLPNISFSATVHPDHCWEDLLALTSSKLGSFWFWWCDLHLWWLSSGSIKEGPCVLSVLLLPSATHFQSVYEAVAFSSNQKDTLLDFYIAKRKLFWHLQEFSIL